jgi:hypothetical protein
MAVTSIVEYRNKETVAVLEELLDQARRGEITGLAFACKVGDKNHGIGLTGDYRDDPISTLAVVSRIAHVLNGLYDNRRRGGT